MSVTLEQTLGSGSISLLQDFFGSYLPIFKKGINIKRKALQHHFLLEQQWGMPFRWSCGIINLMT